jgi:hypothetical protein
MLFIHRIGGAAIIAALTGLVICSCTPHQNAVAAPAAMRFDFGDSTMEKGYRSVGATDSFAADKGYGWVDTSELSVRDRDKPDDLRRDFVMGKKAHIWRLSGLKPGRYLLTIISGDMDYGDHSTQIMVAGNTIKLPLMAPAKAHFMTLSATITAPPTLDITIDSPKDNWVVNALSLEPATAEVAPTLKNEMVERDPVDSTWNPQVLQHDPTKPLLEAFRRNANSTPRDFRVTGLKRADYLKLISKQVDFWKKHQDANGAIIDPYRKAEIQYATPAFANAAAVLVVHNNRPDLLESSSKAMDWATRRLAERKAASYHEDFYPTMIAHTYRLLKPHVPSERVARWESDIRRINPYQTYRMAMGSMNWNIVSLSGEAMFQNLGLRKNSAYVKESLAAQGYHFKSPYGLYLEGPMAYDHFPRIFLADILAQGYAGPYSKELGEALNRAAITSLFMQSPWGELPAGGRSAHHQWNEAEQCVTYEIYAAKAQKEGDEQLAGIYKRAAHLALASMQRWVRPSGEMQIVKNWVDPAKRHAYEVYSHHSQYNLLPMAMLANAYKYAASTETVAERPAPADQGGYILEIPELHKVFANAGGTYVELDTKGDSHYDATGLIRVHAKGVSPQLGPSDSVLAHPTYNSPNPAPYSSGIGAAWQKADGSWQTLGGIDSKAIKNVTVKALEQLPGRIVFDVTYEGDFGGIARVVEHYILMPSGVELTTEVPGYNGPLRYIWPVLADDGKTQSDIKVERKTVSVSQDGGKTAQTFTASGAQNVSVETTRYSNHNGWVRLAIAEFPRGGKITLAIIPTRAK